MTSPLILSKIQEWRQKSRDGTITLEETKEAVQAIRRERVEASTVSATARTRASTAKAKAQPIDSEKLLNEFFD